MARGGKVLSHWSALIDGFNTSGLEFYKAVENAVRGRGLPDAEFSRVEFKEGGFGSARREYLRIERRNVAFDICASPYGNGFFFSWWLCRLGPKHPFLYILGFVAITGFAPFMLTAMLSTVVRGGCSYFLMMPFTFIAVIAGLAYLARQEVFGPEEDILAIPILGWIYEKIFNPITYFTLDTATMFQESIRRSVNEVIDGLLSAQGLHALSEDLKRPTMREIGR